jgi:hypothetical protein
MKKTVMTAATAAVLGLAGCNSGTGDSSANNASSDNPGAAASVRLSGDADTNAIANAFAAKHFDASAPLKGMASAVCPHGSDGGRDGYVAMQIGLGSNVHWHLTNSTGPDSVVQDFDSADKAVAYITANLKNCVR